MLLSRIAALFAKSRRTRRLLVLLAPAALVLACSATSTGTKTDGGAGSADSGNGGGTCGDYSGSWSVVGTCQETDCNATQSGCKLDVQCGGGTAVSGTVTGTQFVLQGSFGDGTQGSCNGTGGAGRTIRLTCSNSCAASATCSFGPCGGATGSGGSATGSSR